MTKPDKLPHSKKKTLDHNIVPLSSHQSVELVQIWTVELVNLQKNTYLSEHVTNKLINFTTTIQLWAVSCLRRKNRTAVTELLQSTVRSSSLHCLMYRPMIILAFCLILHLLVEIFPIILTVSRHVSALQRVFCYDQTDSGSEWWSHVILETFTCTSRHTTRSVWCHHDISINLSSVEWRSGLSVAVRCPSSHQAYQQLSYYGPHCVTLWVLYLSSWRPHVASCWLIQPLRGEEMRNSDKFDWSRTQRIVWFLVFPACGPDIGLFAC